MTLRVTLFCLILTPIISSCDLEEVQNFLEIPLTDEEITQGLKEALEIGTENSVTSASAVNGYLENEAIKILLPEEVQSLESELDKSLILTFTLRDAYDIYVTTTGRTDLFEELVTAMNRGAESAADKAAPIFLNAITSMSISDALGILQGGETAATDYFRQETSAALIAAFQPDVKNALDQTEAVAIYDDIKGFLDYSFDYGLGSISVSNALNVDLPASIDGYATEKAVDGLFHLISEEEKEIREDPFKWASDIIERVFGSEEAQG